ncbi:MAG TPA: ATP-binding cassette domain-containing protein [Steroidobacteraceae bacterium]|nr:ATP-binding cassette domain-containing protein [Steroidobacteraceae bacterium]HNS26759.1 ATP-binding cassette domain-containing protein [Steroidobacteraceae bacterium]
MLTLRDVSLRRGPRVLFEQASVGVFRGDKVGIVGRNGSGKSSLLALIRGELAPDVGDYDAPANLCIAIVEQSVPDSAQSVVDYVREGDTELIRIEHAIAAAHAAGDGHREAQLHADYDAAGGYGARSRAASLATGLGFEADDIERPLHVFSGGLRMRAALARALMRRSDILLLDEPTNHLDLDAVLWLEGWLRAYRGTLLIVSHDREFLDGVVSRILHIEGGRLTAYNGNYSSFERQYAAARERNAALAESQRREIAHVESFVERFRAKASKARQVQSRIKWLERLPAIIEAQGEEAFAWEFPAPAKLPRPLVALDRVSAGYGGRAVFTGLGLSVAPGDRIGVLGRNGAGKSTLMKTVAGALAPLAGERVASPDLEVGFFAQLEVEQLDAASSSIEELARRGGPQVAAWTPQQQRDHLGRFGFRGDRVFEAVRNFSGGERARLTLAIMVARRPNLLLLDEPTNHLDFEMRNALLLALQDYAGAVLIVSHDRGLLRGACDRFMVVAGGSVRPFDGDLEDYAAWLAKGAPTGDGKASGRAGDSRDGAERTAQPQRRDRDTRRREAAARNRLSPLRIELRSIEDELAQLATQRAALERELADDPTKYALATDYERLAARTTSLEERWLELSEEIDAAQRA